MCHELVGKQNGLGVLHMGASGHNGVPRLFGLADQRLDNVEDLPGDEAGMAAQPHADKRGDLVVARPACPQFAA